MTSILSLVLLFIAAYLGALLFRRIQFKALWITGFGYSGGLYILMGMLIGPKFLNILNAENINRLDILFAFVLGWAGFLIGLQTHIPSLKRFRRSHFWFTLINFLITFCVTYLFLNYVKGFVGIRINNGDILALSVAGGVTSPILISLITKEYRISGRISYLLRFNAAFDNILGVVLLGFMIAFLSEAVLWQDVTLSLEMTAVMIALAFLFALLYSVLSRQLRSEEEDRLMIISLLLFLLGTALLFGQSLLFTAFVFGLGVSNIQISTKKLFLDIHSMEKPLYVLLLIYVGASLDYGGTDYLLLLLLFIVVHIISKYMAGVVSNFVVRGETGTSSTIGLSNLGMGGLSLAMILDIHLLNTTRFTEMLLFVVTISIFLNDTISLWYLRRRAGN